MDRFKFWQRWFFVLGVMIVVFGVFMAIFNQTSIFNFFNNQINPVFWQAVSFTEDTAQFQGWIYGVLGATMAGWGLMFIFIVQNPFQARQQWAWAAIAFSLGFWYLLDTAISLYFGVTFNAIFNTLLIGLVMLPLIRTRKYFK